MKKPEQIYEIDVSKKYVIQIDQLLTLEAVEKIKKQWSDFVKDPDQHIVILIGGAKLIKVDETGKEDEVV